MSTEYEKLRSEDTEQETVIQWARMMTDRWPELRSLHHVPNGGARAKKEAVKLKRMGVLAGVPDLHLPVARSGYHSLYIEMKFGDGRILKSQKEFMRNVAPERNYCLVCYTAVDAIEVITNYLHNRAPYENLSVIKNSEKIGTIK